jgi:signal transduction histidine kinase
MFKRIRELHISLAAKCQLLFGGAVVLIISAALLVPGQRIEGLMKDVDRRAASVLADQAVRDHIARPGPRLPWPDRDSPALRSGARLVGVDADPESLTRFEQRAPHRLAKLDKQDYVYQRYDRPDGVGYRYARELRASAECMRCHTSVATGAPSTAPAATSRAVSLPRGALTAATQVIPPALTTQPVTRGTLLGMVSVDIESQLNDNQMLLNRVLLLAAGLFAGTLAIVTLYLIITRLILQPVRVLQETAEKVSRGDLNIRSDISTGDEFQQLSITFNTMLSNLKGNADQLRAINKSLDLKLGQMAESNVALYESNRLKSEFLANVSHELRTPLNSILGFAELLKDSPGATADAKTSRYVTNIAQSGRNLLELINDLLDLAKIEAGRMEVRAEPLSLSDLFEGLTNILKPLCEPKNLQIVADVPSDVPILHTDPGKLQQILYNFLSNAIKFSPVGGRIDLTARREGEAGVYVTVTDRGPGIEPDKQQLIFEKFRQIDGSVTRQHGGSGLGLAISKELSTLLGGAIGITSTPGAGATFWLRLPLKIDSGPKDVRRA